MKFFFVFLLTFLSNITHSQTQFYFQDFESTSNPSGIDWTFDHTVLSNNNNYWVWGAGTAGVITGAATYQGTNSLQIWRRASNAWSATYGNHAGQNRTAQKTFNFSSIPLGSDIDLTFWLLSKGEILSGTYYDYFRVEVNGTVVLGPLVNVNTWTLQSIDLSSYAGNSSVNVRFRWINDGSTVNQPPARVDNIKIEYIEPISLPIVLLYFEGVRYPTFNNLKWATASEQNSSHFDIERSDDGEDWRIIGSRSSAGNSQSLINYSYLDYYNQSNTVYYRLLQYDIDGQYKIYGPILIEGFFSSKKIIKYINLAGQEVNETYKGVVFEVYEDGTMRKIIR